MRITVTISAALLTSTLACTSPLAQDDEAGTTTSPGETETDESGLQEESGDVTSTSESTGTTSTNTTDDCLFLPCTDMPPPVDTCDTFLQDCPEGEKCVPYASSGGSWDANKCVPVVGDQAPGEPCSSGGMVEATDDCDATSICWFVEEVDGQYLGTCVAQCIGALDNPMCEGGGYCTTTSDGPIALCIPNCDPLLQNCDAGLGCYWGNSEFECYSTTEDIPTGEPCSFVNDCAPGHLCADGSAVPGCVAATCCTQYCDLQVGDAGCLAQPGSACVPFFEEGMAPAGLELVGICILSP